MKIDEDTLKMKTILKCLQNELDFLTQKEIRFDNATYSGKKILIEERIKTISDEIKFLKKVGK